MLGLFIYSMPGYLVKKLLGARPNTSMSWILNPVRVVCILAWRSYKFHCLGLLFLSLSLLFLLLLLYSMPGALSQKIVNAIG
ncbi:hypothetical protein SKAU_G00183730 [Synaphobranchus kaupii]|uniref:Ferlin C-terminal domain-containing protein n=1 Tax=Synaphobranchus kaupii TaxID=118154 RepID=A0A9Q1FCC2_SYNKA|nr:hypothetical protein SKAU_G00183730 [Synaphobranchus kaupii]